MKARASLALRSGSIALRAAVMRPLSDADPDVCAAEAHRSTSCMRVTTSALSWRSTVS